MIIAIFFILCVLLIIDFKRTIIAYAPFKFLFTSGVLLYGSITFDNAISLAAFSLFVLKRRKFSSLYFHKPKWPLTISFIILIISETISAVLDNYNYISIPLKFCRNYGFALILYFLIQSKKDFDILIKSTSIYIFLLIGNCLFELIGFNVIGAFLQSNMIEKAFFVDTIDYGSRGLRLHSFLPHSICFGDVCAIFIAVFGFLYYENYQKKMSKLCVALLTIGVILSNSRTPIVALFLYLIPVLQENIYLKNKILFFFILIAITFVFGDKLYQLMDSMFVVDSKYATGSSMVMRLEQLEESFYIAKDAIWFGLGYNYDLSIYEKELRGAESVWFNLLIFGGLFAVLAELTMFTQSIFNTKRFKSHKYIVWLTIGYFFQQSSTYNSGLNDFLFYFCIIIIMSFDIINSKKNIVVNRKIHRSEL